MTAFNHARAILHWWEQVEKAGGLTTIEQPATVSTMLFGCHRWLSVHSHLSSAEEVSKIEHIKRELENWMSTRGMSFQG